ncbi:MAG: hypothetical protein IAG13_01255 [Deltaproteobacteria bacterium]|nr:hypothetical protein [Nannocystaceae bacterium]
MKLANGAMQPAALETLLAADRAARYAELAVIVVLFAMFATLLAAVLAQML